MKILIIGGNRFVGKLVTTALHNSGHNVTIVNRSGTSPVDCTVLCGDRNDTEQFTSVIGDKQFDCVIDMCLYNMQQARDVVNLFGGKVDKYIYVSSIAVYDKFDKIPITEAESANGNNALFGEYGKNKAAIEQYLQQALNFTFPVITVRPTYILGIDNHIYREKYYFDCCYQLLPIEVNGDGKAPISFVFSSDVCEIICNLATTLVPDRAVNNIAKDTPVSVVDLIKLIAHITKQYCLIAVNSNSPQAMQFQNEPTIISNYHIRNTFPKFKFKTLQQGLTEIHEHYYKVPKGEAVLL